MKILSADQIRQWDEYTIHHEPIASIDLVERAATASTNWIIEKYGDKKPIKIFCGKGNNGGDGLAIARQLAANNIITDVYIIEFGNTGTPDFQTNLTRLHHLTVRIHFLQHIDFLPLISENEIVIDAMLGTGLKRPLDGLYNATVEHINNSKATIIAIDMPTGLSTDKIIKSTIINATFTLTFQTLKLAFLLPENEVYSGEVIVLDIGLHQEYLKTVHSIFQLNETGFVKSLLKPRKKFAHKGNFGHALIVAGSNGKTGAAILCTKACLRSGAGLVTSLLPGDSFLALHTTVPEAMAIEQTNILQADLSNYTTIGIGPGMGTNQESTHIVQFILANFNKPIVIDADGLNILAANNELLSELPPGSIITPHLKEFERLFGASQNHLERIQNARYYSQKLFIYIVIKGRYSALACPDGEVYFNNTGNAGMATGGSGDVLTGIITGLLAQGYSPKDACIIGLHLHGLSGDLAAADISQEAMISGDIINYLGKAFLQFSR
jgi:ADP-dependent NAD(P)H-hydrate dehydratase / NAD(P)H-hydrate epimerase